MAYIPVKIEPFHYTQADLKNQENAKRKKSAIFDMRRIDEIIEIGTSEKMRDLHRELDCKYQACIVDWGKSLWGYNDQMGLDNTLGDSSIRDNLLSMRAKIDSFGKGFNEKQSKTHNTNVNVSNVNSNTNEISVIITFEQARKRIEDMTSLNNEQTQEILNKIEEIENAVKEKDSKKAKWDKVKPALKWLADKSFDVGMVILPLLLKLQG